jgi:prepilin-type processing-associated H-X9-DG protein
MRPPGTSKLDVRPDGTVMVSATLVDDDGTLVAQAMPLYPAQMQPGLQGGGSPPQPTPGAMQPPGGMAPQGGGPGMGGPGGPPQQDAPFVAIISLAAPISLDPPPSTITVAATPVANAPGKSYSAQGFMLHACPGNQTLLYGQQKYLEVLLKSKATSPGATVKKVREMLGKPENHMVMVAASEMTEAERNAAVGGMGPKFQYAAPLLEARNWTIVGSATEDVSIELAGQFADEAKAKAGLEAANRLNKENNTFQTRLALTAFGAMAGAQGSKAIGLLNEVLAQIKPAQEGNSVKVVANIKGARLKALVPAGMGAPPRPSSGAGKTPPSVGIGTPPPAGSSQNTGLFSGGSTGGGAVQAVRGAVARAAGQNELKQIGLALNTYMTDNNGLPPAAITDPSGKRLLSWRVAILPYLEQDNLYKQFHLNEPWDSPHNRQLLSKMPKQFGGDSNGRTALRAFAGPGMAFEWNRKVALSEIADGASNTALIADASEGVEWTKPDELDFGGSAPIVLGQPNQATVNVLFADGAVKRVPKTLTPAEWKALATRAGGEQVKLP